MSKQRAVKSEYRVYYGTDRNAALQPQYVREEVRKNKPNTDQRRKAKAARKAEVALYARVTVAVIAVAAMGFFIVSRNAQIYSNRNEIQKLAKEKSELQVMIHTAEKDCSAGSELNSYFDIAQNELKLSYPDDERIVTVACAQAASEAEASENQTDINVYDTVLDWISSLERRIKSWA